MGTEPQAVTNGAALAAVEREREWWESLLAEVGEASMLTLMASRARSFGDVPKGSSISSPSASMAKKV